MICEMVSRNSIIVTDAGNKIAFHTKRSHIYKYYNNVVFVSYSFKRVLFDEKSKTQAMVDYNTMTLI